LLILQVNFSYHEAGEDKQALVKLVACERCAEKLYYKKRKEGERSESKEKKKQKRKRSKSHSEDDTDEEEKRKEGERSESNEKKKQKRNRYGERDSLILQLRVRVLFWITLS
jgi:protein FRA10AC1